MKTMTLLTTLTFVMTNTEVGAQSVLPSTVLECPPGEGSVRSRTLSSDSLSTSFLLCIHGGVKPHLHAHHTEHVHVLEGNGTMLLGDSVFTVSAGSFIAIPRGTPHAVRVSGDAPLRVISVQAPYFDGSDRVPVDVGTRWPHP